MNRAKRQVTMEKVIIICLIADRSYRWKTVALILTLWLLKVKVVHSLRLPTHNIFFSFRDYEYSRYPIIMSGPGLFFALHMRSSHIAWVGGIWALPCIFLDGYLLLLSSSRQKEKRHSSLQYCACPHLMRYLLVIDAHGLCLRFVLNHARIMLLLWDKMNMHNNDCGLFTPHQSIRHHSKLWLSTMPVAT